MNDSGAAIDFQGIDGSEGFRNPGDSGDSRDTHFSDKQRAMAKGSARFCNNSPGTQ